MLPSQTRSTLRDFLRYACLNALGMAALSCYILADTFFIARGVGPNGLTALNLAIPVYNFIHGTGLMLGMGGAVKYAVLQAQGAQDQANQAFSRTVYLAALASAGFLLLGLFLAPSLTRLLGADPEVFAMTNTYLRVLLLFSPAFIFNDVLLCFVRNDGHPQLCMAAMIGGSMLNILLDYVFIFPLGMGIFGAVLATGIAPLFNMTLVALNWRKNRLCLVKAKPEKKSTWAILRLGFSSLVTEVSSGVVILVFNLILLRLAGNTAVAAYGVVANLSIVVISIFTGVAQGAQPLFSRFHGRGDPKELRSTLTYGAVAILLLSLLVYGSVFFGAEPIAALFNREQDPFLQETAVLGMKLYFTATAFAGLNILLTTYFAATERPAPAQLLSLLRGLFLIVPAAFLLSALWGLPGVWLSFPSTELAVSLLGLVLYRRARTQEGAGIRPVRP